MNGWISGYGRGGIKSSFWRESAIFNEWLDVRAWEKRDQEYM